MDTLKDYMEDPCKYDHLGPARLPLDGSPGTIHPTPHNAQEALEGNWNEQKRTMTENEVAQAEFEKFTVHSRANRLAKSNAKRAETTPTSPPTNEQTPPEASQTPDQIADMNDPKSPESHVTGNPLTSGDQSLTADTVPMTTGKDTADKRTLSALTKQATEPLRATAKVTPFKAGKPTKKPKIINLNGQEQAAQSGPMLQTTTDQNAGQTAHHNEIPEVNMKDHPTQNHKARRTDMSDADNTMDNTMDEEQRSIGYPSDNEDHMSVSTEHADTADTYETEQNINDDNSGDQQKKTGQPQTTEEDTAREQRQATAADQQHNRGQRNHQEQNLQAPKGRGRQNAKARAANRRAEAKENLQPLIRDKFQVYALYSAFGNKGPDMTQVKLACRALGDARESQGKGSSRSILIRTNCETVHKELTVLGLKYEKRRVVFKDLKTTGYKENEPLNRNGTAKDGSLIDVYIRQVPPSTTEAEVLTAFSHKFEVNMETHLINSTKTGSNKTRNEFRLRMRKGTYIKRILNDPMVIVYDDMLQITFEGDEYDQVTQAHSTLGLHGLPPRCTDRGILRYLETECHIEGIKWVQAIKMGRHLSTTRSAQVTFFTIEDKETAENLPLKRKGTFFGPLQSGMCFMCGSTSHGRKDCDKHPRPPPRKSANSNPNTGQTTQGQTIRALSYAAAGARHQNHNARVINMAATSEQNNNEAAQNDAPTPNETHHNNNKRANQNLGKPPHQNDSSTQPGQQTAQHQNPEANSQTETTTDKTKNMIQETLNQMMTSFQSKMEHQMVREFQFIGREFLGMRDVLERLTYNLEQPKQALNEDNGKAVNQEAIQQIETELASRYQEQLNELTAAQAAQIAEYQSKLDEFTAIIAKQSGQIEVLLQHQNVQNERFDAMEKVMQGQTAKYNRLMKDHEETVEKLKDAEFYLYGANEQLQEKEEDVARLLQENRNLINGIKPPTRQNVPAPVKMSLISDSEDECKSTRGTSKKVAARPVRASTRIAQPFPGKSRA
jgi:hypothetical protein